MYQSRRFLQKRLGTIITEQILSHLQKVPPEVYSQFKTMRGQKSVVEIFENLIIKHLWTNEVQVTIKTLIQQKLNDKWVEDEERIWIESFENVEKRQKLLSQQDDSAIQKELLYQRYNTKLIREIFKYFEEHGQGEDYVKLLVEAEDAATEESGNESEGKSGRSSSKVERQSTEESGSVHNSK